jgi:hydrogenase-4 membrane subunit HyfE
VILGFTYGLPELFALAAVILVVKGRFAPRLLAGDWILGDEAVHRWTGPTGTVGSLLAAVAVIGVSFSIAAFALPLDLEVVFGGCLATGLLGVLLPVLRHELSSHASGLLIAEEGFSSAGLLLVATAPRLAEIATLVDLLVLAVVFGVLLRTVARVHGAMDAALLRELRG